MYVVNKHRPMVGQDISPNWPHCLTWPNIKFGVGIEARL